MLLEDVHAPEAVDAIAADISRRLCSPYEIDGEEVVVSAAVGTALSITGQERPDDILRSADSAMYQAKLRGRSRGEAGSEAAPGTSGERPPAKSLEPGAEAGAATS